MFQESGLEDVFIVWPLRIELCFGTIAGKIVQQGNYRTQIDYGGASAFEMGRILLLG